MSEATKKSAILAEIDKMGKTEENVAQARTVAVKAPTPTAKSSGGTGPFELGVGEDGTLSNKWDPFLPRPPSMRELASEVDPNAEQVAVFNSNTQEGSTMVRVLSEKGLRVVAAVRVFTSKNTKALIKLKGVTVKVADKRAEEVTTRVAADHIPIGAVVPHAEEPPRVVIVVLHSVASVIPLLCFLQAVGGEVRPDAELAEVWCHPRLEVVVPGTDQAEAPAGRELERREQIEREGVPLRVDRPVLQEALGVRRHELPRA